MQIHPIQNEEDHAAALKRIEALMSAPLNSAAGAELDALATLVDAYEAKHFSIDAPTPIAAIEFYLDQNGLSRKDLVPLIGTRARVSEVMTGKRSLTLSMIRRLKEELGISADSLVDAPVRSMRTHKVLTSRGKSPQVNKELSLQRDRRNTYGENAKSSRKNIPRSKQRSHQQMRYAANGPLQSIKGSVSEDFAIEVELKSRTNAIQKSRTQFKKHPDKPLGQVLERKRTSAKTSRKALKCRTFSRSKPQRSRAPLFLRANASRRHFLAIRWPALRRKPQSHPAQLHPSLPRRSASATLRHPERHA
jgi:HTH-type transcriptional regulator/antitoxin HigA